MKKLLMLFLVGCIMVTSGCSKEKLKSLANNPKAIVGAVATGLCAGAYYFREGLGLKKKKTVKEDLIDATTDSTDLETVEEAIVEALS